MRTSAGLDSRRKQILYRCWHRGTREMDLVLGRFADAHLADLSDGELAELETLMLAPDPEIYKLLSGASETPANYDTGIVRRIRAFHKSGDTAE